MSLYCRKYKKRFTKSGYYNIINSIENELMIEKRGKYNESGKD